MTVYAFAAGSFVFIGVVIAFFFAIVWGFYTVKGSGINQHPNGGLDGAPGSAGPSSAVGKGRTPEDHGGGMSAGGAFSTHGTK
jgi:hypothetical protein